MARVLRLLGTIGREGPLDTLREAVEVAEESTAKLERAKALVALGSALRRGRKPSAARDALTGPDSLTVGLTEILTRAALA